MMKRCAALCCAALMVIGLCACKKEAPDAPPAMVPTTTTSPVVEDTARAPLNLTYASPFSDGIAFVRHMDADGVEHAVAINTAGDVLFALAEGMESSRYQDGVCVVGDVVYNKTGTAVASPEAGGYDHLLTGNCGGYLLAKKVTIVTPSDNLSNEAAPTNTPAIGAPLYSVGVLNTKGEWVHPLSAEHPIAVAMTAAAQPVETFTYLPAAGVLQVYVDAEKAPQYYHFADNTLTDNYSHYESINYQDEETGIYQVADDGTKKLMIKDVVSEYSFKDVFIGRTVTVDEEGNESVLLKLYDYKGKALADLTDYPTKEKYYFVDDRLLITVDDGSGSRYMAMLGKDGKPLIDPVPLNLRDVVCPPDEAGFVVISRSAEGAVSYRHYDYAGHVTDYTDVTVFTNFSEGLAAVTLTDGTLCYINYKAEIVIR